MGSPRIHLPTAIPVRFCPSKETLTILNEREWICSFSGGKDSTSLVTWIEWLRRIGLVRCDTPRLVMSDTTVEYPFLRAIADQLMTALAACGWKCEIVKPPVNQRLYNRIFGIGNTPVHPGGRKRMRWCTRATKIDPMEQFTRTLGEDVMQLSGVRWGESNVRDGKLKASGCAAGGECGLPEVGDKRNVYGPIITWRTCQVIECLSGECDGAEAAIPDLLALTRQLVDVYGVQREKGLLAGMVKVTALRFGCIGCPAITNEKVTQSKSARQHPEWAHLRRIYDIWDKLYANRNRCCRVRGSTYKSGRPGPPSWEAGVGYGPLKMTARKTYFAELLDIQEKSGVTLVTAEDEAFIRDCWEKKKYPRGWSEADELVQPPLGPNLFSMSQDA